VRKFSHLSLSFSLLHPIQPVPNLVKTPRRRREEPEEGLARREHAAQVLGVELHAHEPRVVADLDDLHALARRVLADEGEPGRLETLDHLRVDLVPVAVALGDLGGVAVEGAEAGPFGSLLEVAAVLA
jgi:hypothetical protein